MAFDTNSLCVSKLLAVLRQHFTHILHEISTTSFQNLVVFSFSFVWNCSLFTSKFKTNSLEKKLFSSNGTCYGFVLTDVHFNSVTLLLVNSERQTLWSQREQFWNAASEPSIYVQRSVHIRHGGWKFLDSLPSSMYRLLSVTFPRLTVYFLHLLFVFFHVFSLFQLTILLLHSHQTPFWN